MTRYMICVGDTTTSGGVVITGCATERYMGRQRAFEQDQVQCPACNSTGQIVCAGDRVPVTGPHGREQALSDDLCICRCSPPPRLVSAQHTGTVSGSAPRTQGWGSTVQTGAAAHKAGDTHDQRFLVQDEDGRPVADRRYRAIYPGGVIEGRTGSDGYTERFSATHAASVRIEVYAEGA